MLPIKLNLPKKFFKEENRDGIIVTTETKELWAVQLDLLNELLEVCKANNLQIFADSGTLLGAIRHKGYIPWDDDIDMIMFRPDYEKLCKIAKKAFKKPYFFQTMYTDIGYGHLHAKLRNTATTCIMKAEQNADIPYNQGVFIDIFVLDYVPDDIDGNKKPRINYMSNVEYERKKLYKLMKATINYKQRRDTFLPGTLLLRSIVDNSGKTYNEVVTEQAIKTDKLIKSTMNVPTAKTCAQEFFSWKGRHIFMSEWYKKTKYAKFEMLKIPIPAMWEDVLLTWYGDTWNIPIKGDGQLHGHMITDMHKSYKEFLKQKGN